MKSTKSNRIINGLALVFAMTFGFLLFAGTDVNAQSRDQRDDRQYDDRYNQNDRNRNNNGYYNDDQDDDRYNGRDRNGNQSVRFAYQRGFQAGIKQGREDARNRRRINGNNGSYGNNGGYGSSGNSGYGNNGSYGNGNRDNSQLRQAYQNGFNRGYQESMNRYRSNRGTSLGRILNLPF